MIATKPMLEYRKVLKELKKFMRGKVWSKKQQAQMKSRLILNTVRPLSPLPKKARRAQRPR